MTKKGNMWPFIMAILGCSLFIASCNDDFSEEDLMRLQLQLANEQDSIRAAHALAALDSAGEFFDFTIVVNNDDNLIADASVTLHGQAGGNITQVTDANGATTFSSVSGGGNIVTISATGFAAAVLNIDFPELQYGVNYEVVNGVYVPIKASTSAIIPLFATDPSAGSVATIRGKVEIETDLTNTTPEIPQNINISASVDIASVTQSDQSATGGVRITRYAFDGGQVGFGTATVDNATGNYSMMVPATASGLPIRIEAPNIEASQRLAVGFVDYVALPRPEYRNVPANFGPAYSGSSNIPFINGAIALFQAPPTPGAGFTLSNFQRVGAPLHLFSLDRRLENITSVLDKGEVILQMTSLGSGYTSSPTITINDANGSGATAEAHVEFAVDGVTVTTAGAGYLPMENITMNIIAVRQIDASTTQDQPFPNPLTVTADANGDIGQNEVNAAITAAINGGITGYEVDDPVHVTTSGTIQQSDQFFASDEMASIRVEFSGGLGTPPAGTVSLGVSRVFRVEVTSTGINYTNPTFTFSGGGSGATQAALSVLQYGTRWSFSLDNSNISSNYTVLPENIYFEYEELSVPPVQTNTSVAADVREFVNGSFRGSLDFIGDQLLTPSSGGLAYVKPLATYETDFFAASTPQVRVVERQTAVPHAEVSISLNGEVAGLFVLALGDGYQSPFDVTIEPSAVGAPGAGAAIELIGGSNSGDEYQWFGSTILSNRGSGYLFNLNLHGSISGNENFSFGTGAGVVNVKTGDIVVVNINYGTGTRQVNVDGHWYSTY